MESTEQTPDTPLHHAARDASPDARFRRGPDPRIRRRFTPLRMAGMAALIALCVLLYGFVTQQLWNWLMPSIFHLRSVTFFEAVGLVLLGKLLFGGIHKHGGRGKRGWRPRMRQHFASLSPEEREKFRAGMRSRWNCRPQTETNRADANQGARSSCLSANSPR